MSGWLVVTDLDGTLLDHDSYDHSAALPALQALSRAGIPVVANTSKTLAETTVWQQQLGLESAAAVENGSAVQLAGVVRPLGTPRGDLVATLRAWRAGQGWRFCGFSDMDVAALRRHTGLSAQAARRSLEREWSEPLIWQDDEAAWQDFRAAVAARGWRLLRGGRFWHLVGDCDKGRATQALREAWPDAPRLIGLGDSDNDRDLLAAADIAIWVRSPVREPAPLGDHPRELRSRGTGPAGWNEMILKLLDDGTLD